MTDDWKAQKAKIKEIAGKISLDYEKHPLSESVFLGELIGEIDFLNGDSQGYKFGGDGDNGESLITILDALFEKGYIKLNVE